MENGEKKFERLIFIFIQRIHWICCVWCSLARAWLDTWIHPTLNKQTIKQHVSYVLKIHPKHLIYVKTKMDKKANQKWFGQNLMKKGSNASQMRTFLETVCATAAASETMRHISKRDIEYTQPFTRDKSFSIVVGCRRHLCISHSLLLFFRWESIQ